MLRIELPDSVLLATGQSREDFLRDARLLLVLKLYELGRLSGGRAAELSGLSRAGFLTTASRLGTPVADLDDHDLARELADA